MNDKKIRIAFTGTRGLMSEKNSVIGGFEKFVTKISKILVSNNIEVTVYTPHYIETPDNLHNIKIKKIFAPERSFSIIGTILYDFLSFLDAKRKNFDLIFECGYASFFLAILFNKKNKKPYLAVNMDGLEWKRYNNSIIRRFLLFIEALTIKLADFIIADHLLIKEYLEKKYKIKPILLSYGSDKPNFYYKNILEKYELKPKEYFIMVSRPVKENNVEMIFEVFNDTSIKNKFKLVWITNIYTKYAKKIMKKYKHSSFKFLTITNDMELFSLRHYAKAYIHGHSVGGTNPSLLEAMYSDVPIISFDSPFNKITLNGEGCYFTNVNDLKNILFTIVNNGSVDNCKINGIEKNQDYSWNLIYEEYIKFITKVVD